MGYPVVLTRNEVALTVKSGASISTGFTVSVASPTRGEITGVYLSPSDGTAITAGPANLTFTIANVVGIVVSMAAAAVGFSSGGSILGGAGILPTLGGVPARQFVNEGDIITMVLAAGLTNAATSALVTVVLRTRTI